MFTVSAAPVMIGGEAIAAAASAPPVLMRNSLRFCLGKLRRTDRFIVIPPWDIRRPRVPAASVLIVVRPWPSFSAQPRRLPLLYTLLVLTFSRLVPGNE